MLLYQQSHHLLLYFFLHELVLYDIALCYKQLNFIDLAIENIEQYNNIRYNSLVQIFDYEKLKMGIDIRSRNDGDVFKPLSSQGTKKLKEYFIDKKIPRDIRKTLPLVALGKEIVWIMGYKISDKFKVTENTKSVLKLEINKLRDTI